jgi:hypothetical protein
VPVVKETWTTWTENKLPDRVRFGGARALHQNFKFETGLGAEDHDLKQKRSTDFVSQRNDTDG